MQGFKIWLLIGLPGCGKTTWLREVKGHKIDDWGIRPGQWEQIDLAHQDNSPIYIGSIDFCDGPTLENFKRQCQHKYGDVGFEYIYFQNNPHKCAQNIISRSRLRGDHYIVVDGQTRMVGQIFGGQPLWQLELEKLFMLSENYVVPVGYRPEGGQPVRTRNV